MILQKLQPVRMIWIVVAAALVVGIMAVGSPTPWVGISLIVFWLICYASGIVFLPDTERVSPDHQDFVIEHAVQTVLGTATGICVAIMCWMVSAYAAHALWPGTLALISIAVFGMFLHVKKTGNLLPVSPSALSFALVCTAVLLGIYQNAIIEVSWKDSILFSGPFRSDLYVHAHVATLLREQGLPLVDNIGNPDTPFKAPTHVGLMVLLAGIENLTHVSIFQASRILVPMAYALLVLSALSLILRPNRNRMAIFLAAISPLVWGGLTLPLEVLRGNLAGVVMPYMGSIVRPSCPSGSLYHNLTQLYSITLTGAGLTALKQYLSNNNTQYFVLACIFIGVTFIVKPSITILTIPAMFIFLLLCRENVNRWFISIGIFSIFIGIFYIPSILVTNLPEKNSWVINISHSSIKELILRYGILIGATWIFLGKRLKSIIRSCLNHQRLDVEDYILIALVGGIFFSFMFEEQGRRWHGNHNWGLTGTLILIAPFVTAALFDWINTKSLPIIANGIRKWIIFFLLGCHLLGGAVYALTFPLIKVEFFSPVVIDTLKQLRSHTPPKAAFLFDPSFPYNYKLMAYLARPALWGYTWTRHQKKQYDLWIQSIKNNYDPILFINGRHAFVVGPNTQWMKPILIKHHWRFSRTVFKKNNDYEMWVSPDM